MGNSWACFAPKEMSFTGEPSKRFPNSSRKTRTSSSPSKNKGKLDEDAFIQQQAIAAALLFRHHQQNDSLSLNRSTSLVFPSSPGPKKLPKSSSSRQRSRSDSLIQPHQLVIDKDPNVNALETNHFVLVHGGGFGAWCWYKIMTLLEEGGYRVDAVDLTGAGIHSFDTNSIASLAQYVKPLTDFLDKLGDGEKVILAGHDFGGACISYAMELFPSKISKAIFIAAAMLSSGQSTLDMFSQQADSNDLMRQAQIFLYANGKDQAPTAIDLDKTLVKDLLFNQSPAKDITLALVSMRPIPLAPVMEKLSLSDKDYGSVRRFYIVTQEDSAIPVSLQESMIKINPPEQVFWLKGSDHAPFFSRPQSLHKMLVEIAQIPSKQV
ncbi:putative methylesterase 11, chloroplastic [Juglans microcarpa x Juglans regia]|uniref:putative methylesterase 11, chloroplastic n=1 Tax=Juglans microcarpa x Juglans regia TaxID=2249226 RepID=UPI001B7D9E14|nr:putative methylesterase 11, chloroplastic [Juglans microcarpa x Juglans regia]XP_041013267.1 putative methylesterase 11, chloroplastic [Juglans microcarpa x Juglans regia]